MGMAETNQTNLQKEQRKEQIEKVEAVLEKKKEKKNKIVRHSKARELGSFWVNNSVKFVSELKKPTGKQYKQMLRLYCTGALLVGLFCYGIKVIHIPINNIFVGN